MASIQHLPGYRLELRMPRDLQSDPVTEPDVLVPRPGAAHGEAFRLTTLADDDWGRGYLGLPSGRRGTLDLRSRKVTVGGVGVNLLDPRVADDNAVRWLTQFLGDANGNPQLAARLRAQMWQTLDDGCSWAPYFAGRTARATKPTPPEYGLELEDMASELQRDCFVGPPHASVDYAQLAPLLPYGLITEWAGCAAKGPAPATKATTSGRRRLVVRRSAEWDKYLILCADLRARGAFLDLGRVVSSFTIGIFSGERVKVRVRNPATDAAGWFWLRQLKVQPSANGHWVATELVVDELAIVLNTWAALGADGAALEFACYANDALCDTGALLIGPVHPVRYLRDLVDGKFGYLDANGNVRRQVPRSTTDPVWDRMIADESFGTVAFIRRARSQVDTEIEKKLGHLKGLAYAFDGEGNFTPIDVRRPAAFLTLPEITDDDLIAAPGAEDWEQSAGGAITRVGVTWREDTAIPVDEIVKATDTVPAVPAGLIRETPQAIYDPPFFGDDPRTPVGTRFGDKPFEVDAEGLRGRRVFISTAPLSSALPAALALAREVMQPYASGERTITLKCKRTPVVLGTAVGAPRLVTIAALPDPATNRYGETRLMRCVGVQEQGVAVALKFADLGLASVAGPPFIGEPANGLAAGDVTVEVNRDAADDPFEIWGLLTDTTVAVRPADDDPAWCLVTGLTVDGFHTIGPYPGGKRLWVKARSVPGLFGAAGGSLEQPSAFAYPSDYAAVNDYVDVAQLTGLANLTVSNITAAGCDLAWEGGEDTAEIAIYLADGSVTIGDDVTPTFAVWNFTRWFRIQGLAPNTLYTVEIRLLDPLGGFGTRLSTEFTTAGGTITLDRPAGIDFVFWSSIEGRVFPSSAYPIELQRAADDSGPDLGNIENVAVGPDGIFNDLVPADQSLYWYRARHVPSSNSGSAVVASDWTAWVGAVARGTQGTGGGGGGTGNGDLPTDQQPGVGTNPGGLTPVLPRAQVTRTDDGAGNCGVVLALTDPQGRAQRVEFQTQVGAAPPSAWTPDPTQPYGASSTYTSAAATAIRWRVIGFDAQNRPEQTLLIGEERFGGSIAGTAEFIVNSADANLPNARVLTDSFDVEKDTTVPGVVRLRLTETGVIAGLYGDATHAVEIEVDDTGRIVAITEVPIAASGGGARTVTSFATGVIAVGGQATGVVALAKGSVLWGVVITNLKQARVRLYATAAARDADLARPMATRAVSGSYPAGTGIAADAVLAPNTSFALDFDEKPILGDPTSPSPTTTMYWTVDNLTGSATDVEVALHHTPFEA
jgi:hypothetical protein